jgi:hypothetical protein
MAWEVKRYYDAKVLIKDFVDHISVGNGYRGHGDAAWKLEASIDRKAKMTAGYADRLNEELLIVEKFKKRTPRCFGPVESVGSEIAAVDRHARRINTFHDFTHDAKVWI